MAGRKTVKKELEDEIVENKVVENQEVENNDVVVDSVDTQSDSDIVVATEIVETIPEEVEEVKVEQDIQKEVNEEEPKAQTKEKKEKKEKKDVVEKKEPHITLHNYTVGDEVWVASFEKSRDSSGYTRIVNSYRFMPVKGVVERIVITDKVRYKLVHKAGSNYDEEDVCSTYEEALALSNKKNLRNFEE